MDGFIRIYDETIYLTLLGSKKYNAIYDRIRYLLSVKSGVTSNFLYYFAKIKDDSYDSLPIEKILTLYNIKGDSYDSLPIEKILTLYNIIILIKSVRNKDKYHYHF